MAVHLLVVGVEQVQRIVHLLVRVHQLLDTGHDVVAHLVLQLHEGLLHLHRVLHEEEARRLVGGGADHLELVREVARVGRVGGLELVEDLHAVGGHVGLQQRQVLLLQPEVLEHGLVLLDLQASVDKVGERRERIHHVLAHVGRHDTQVDQQLEDEGARVLLLLEFGVDGDPKVLHEVLHALLVEADVPHETRHLLVVRELVPDQKGAHDEDAEQAEEHEAVVLARDEEVRQRNADGEVLKVLRLLLLERVAVDERLIGAARLNEEVARLRGLVVIRVVPPRHGAVRLLDLHRRRGPGQSQDGVRVERERRIHGRGQQQQPNKGQEDARADHELEELGENAAQEKGLFPQAHLGARDEHLGLLAEALHHVGDVHQRLVHLVKGVDHHGADRRVVGIVVQVNAAHLSYDPRNVEHDEHH
ncbi:translocation protein SEC63 [Strigomonas culicis]|uniref:Translocation protein SEC63 n=1 Tax=Strigomonas culicis TaxID=28005 RepID=S9U9T7_9TRYP|nr:translocation protein SEC63 [Strigomonas culicis]|eukprot:EPY25688.1 translocation protein SEC63 [Strigomonas culicis]